MNDRFENKAQAEKYRAQVAPFREETFTEVMTELGFITEAGIYRDEPERRPQVIMEVTTRLVLDCRTQDLERLMKARVD